jgi:hypothetical protein
MWGAPFFRRSDEADVLNTLRRWYLETSEEQERRGDVSLHPFDGNVVPIVCVKGYAGELVVPLSQMNPYQSSFFLFYSYSDFDICVWGGLSWKKMYELGGRISPISKDLIRNRAFPLVYENLFETQSTLHSKDQSQWWWIPLDLPRTPGFVNQVNATMDDINNRLRWILDSNNRSRRSKRSGSISSSFPQENSVSPLALGIFECTIENAEKRMAFHEIRMRREQTVFEKELMNLSEQEYLELFRFNGLEQYMQEAMVKTPTQKDLYSFWCRYSNLSPPTPPPPTVVFRVPLEEYPFSMNQMPVYSYGLVHLTYKELSTWLWNLFVLQSQKLAVRKCDFYREEDRWLIPLHTILSKSDFNSSSSYSSSFDSSNTNVLENIDIEDILSVAPPCVSNCISAPRFPPHVQRKRLLPILQTAGVSRELVFEWFEKKNSAYPKPESKNMGAKARFDYEALWKAKRGPTHCNNIVREQGHDTLRCPYGGDKSACAPDEYVKFSGPHDLIKRRMERRKK